MAIKDMCGEAPHNAYNLCTIETQRVEAWLNTHVPGNCWIEKYDEGGLGNTPYSIIISPNSIGNDIKVKCNTCGIAESISHIEHA